MILSRKRSKSSKPKNESLNRAVFAKCFEPLVAFNFSLLRDIKFLSVSRLVFFFVKKIMKYVVFSLCAFIYVRMLIFVVSYRASLQRVH